MILEEKKINKYNLNWPRMLRIHIEQNTNY